MSLQNKIEEIRTLLPLANEVLEAGNPQTLAARRGRQRSAQDKLSLEKSDLIRSLVRSSVYLIVSGDLAEDFAKAAESYSGFTADPEQFYREMASSLSPELYENKSSVGTVFDVLGRKLEDKMQELGVSAYPQLVTKAQYIRNLKNADELTSLVKEAVNDQVGAEIVGIQAWHSTLEQVVQRGLEGSTALMLLPTQDEQLAVSLGRDLKRLSPNVFVVAAGKTSKGIKNTAGDLAIKKISDEAIKAVLKSVKAQKV